MMASTNILRVDAKLSHHERHAMLKIAKDEGPFKEVTRRPEPDYCGACLHKAMKNHFPHACLASMPDPLAASIKQSAADADREEGEEGEDVDKTSVYTPEMERCVCLAFHDLSWMRLDCWTDCAYVRTDETMALIPRSDRMAECEKWIDLKTGKDLMAGKLKNDGTSSSSSKRKIKGEERHLAKDPSYVPKQYHHAGVEREDVEEESPVADVDEDNLEDYLNEEEAAADEDVRAKDDSEGSPKTAEAETLEQLQKILKLEPLQNLKKDLRDYKNEKERKEIWKSVYDALSGLDMDRIREMVDQQQKKVDAEKKDKQWKDEL